MGRPGTAAPLRSPPSVPLLQLEQLELQAPGRGLAGLEGHDERASLLVDLRALDAQHLVAGLEDLGLGRPSGHPDHAADSAAAAGDLADVAARLQIAGVEDAARGSRG